MGAFGSDHRWKSYHLLNIQAEAIRGQSLTALAFFIVSKARSAKYALTA
jgi:hypothetical protein